MKTPHSEGGQKAFNLYRNAKMDGDERPGHVLGAPNDEILMKTSLYVIHRNGHQGPGLLSNPNANVVLVSHIHTRAHRNMWKMPEAEEKAVRLWLP